jgi:RHS repeat-associated protein
MTDSSGNVVAKYLYDPFGNLLAKSGAMADVNRYRFSSKEVHPNSGLFYYGYRFYEPNLQRWLNEDPIRERGGMNLFGFVGNRPINGIDPFGLLASGDEYYPGQEYENFLEDQLGAPIGYFQNEREKIPGALTTCMVTIGGEAALVVSGEAVAVGAEGAIASVGAKAVKIICSNRYFRISKGWVPAPGENQWRAAWGGKKNFVHGHIDSSNWYKPWKWFQKIGGWKNYE